jgi:hypothetical protein
MFRRVKFAYDCLLSELKTLRSVDTDNVRELHLSNGSTLRIGIVHALKHVAIPAS